MRDIHNHGEEGDENKSRPEYPHDPAPVALGNEPDCDRSFQSDSHEKAGSKAFKECAKDKGTNCFADQRLRIADLDLVHCTNHNVSSLRPHQAHPHLAIVMGRRDPQAVGVQVHVAGGVGQRRA